MEYLAVFPSLIAFAVAFLFAKAIGDRGAEILTCSGVILSAVASCYLFYDVVLLSDPRTLFLAQWLATGDLRADWALRFDTLSIVMLCVITIVSSCVHVYSVGYMAHDKSRARFMSYLSLFTFAMIMLVTADNLLQLFFGWEGVGLASYLLIGFWNHKETANNAAIKAFIVNRVGDLGLILGIMAVFVLTQSTQFDDIFASIPQLETYTVSFLGFDIHAITLAGILLFVGAVGKSAQLGLHTWLPDAMEGPTPVSALIHAATMVTAGVFLIARFSPLYEYAPVALEIITFFGATTAIVAATIGLTQFDIKRVIAYSTMSQLGYMFFALGVSAYEAAMFHLVTHAFFKSLLFLGAGSVIHGLSDEQDMRRMGGVWKKLPITYAMMWIGSLALAGIPFFAGFYSKDMILEAAWADHSIHGNYAFILGLIAALMTSFYSFRLIFLTFHGKPRMEEKVWSHVHESPKIMLYPLYVLALGALFSGFLLYSPFVGGGKHEKSDPVPYETQYSEDNLEDRHVAPGEGVAWSRHAFWQDSILVKPENDTVEAAHHTPLHIKLIPVILALLGIGMAWLFYIRYTWLPERIVEKVKPLHRLFYNKWYFDEIYDRFVVRSAWAMGSFFSFAFDKVIIDGLGPNGFAFVSRLFGRLLSRVQSGFIFHYAFFMMIGVFGLVSWVFYKIMMN